MLHVGQTDTCPSYQIVGDNVDLHQTPTHQSVERKARDHHWFHLYAARDRITGAHLSNDSPITDIALQTFLPSVEDCLCLREEFAVLIARVLTAKLPYFEPLQSVTPVHIRHKHSSDVSIKSEIVSAFFVLD